MDTEYLRENVPEYPRDLPEPLHQRVTTLEKQIREMRERIEEQDSSLRGFIERVARELGF